MPVRPRRTPPTGAHPPRPPSTALARRVEVGEIVERFGADDVGRGERTLLIVRLAAALASCGCR